MHYFSQKICKNPFRLSTYKLYHTSKHTNYDLTFLRHAQSNYNIASQEYIKKNNLSHLTWDQICQIRDFNLDINYNRKFIDSDLSEKGLSQCYILRQQYLAKRKDIDLILCSPMIRALRTCKNVFYPFHVKKIIIPELTQVLRYSCDISNDIQEKKQQFKQFDWNYFSQNDNLWYINTQTKVTQQKIRSQIIQNRPNSFEQIQYELLMLLYEGRVYETDFDLRRRSNKIKQLIKQYKKSYKNIIIISHHYMLQHLLAYGYRKDHQPISAIVDEVPNATPVQSSLKQIMMVQ